MPFQQNKPNPEQGSLLLQALADSKEVLPEGGWLLGAFLKKQPSDAAKAVAAKLEQRGPE